MTDFPASVAVHAYTPSETDDRYDRLVQAVIEIYGEDIPGIGRSIERRKAIVDLTALLTHLIAGDPQREQIASDVRQGIKLGVRRIAAMMARQKTGTA